MQGDAAERHRAELRQNLGQRHRPALGKDLGYPNLSRYRHISDPVDDDARRRPRRPLRARARTGTGRFGLQRRPRSGDPLIEIARAASEAAGAGGRVEAWTLEDARSVLWAFADAIACDQVISGEKAERELGWRPSRRSIIDELRSYRSAIDRGRPVSAPSTWQPRLGDLKARPRRAARGYASASTAARPCSPCCRRTAPARPAPLDRPVPSRAGRGSSRTEAAARPPRPRTAR